VANALDPYLANQCEAVLKILEKVENPDRNQFVYAYMTGACLLRLERPKEADQWLSTASSLTDGRRVAMALSAQGITKLFQWRSSNDRHYVDDAIRIFQSALSVDPGFAPAYFNLACAYAQGKDYAQATRYLTLPRTKQIRGGDAIIQRIKEDLSRPTERFLLDYVQGHLRVLKPQDDPRWSAEMRAALKL
jgi:tetratricopeptide (TPR) repeat protein